jgi:hypothetical protein
VGEALGPLQIRLLELQPRQVVDLDEGIAGASRMLARHCAVLAV